MIRCIIVDDEAIAREILESHLAKIDTVKVLASCKNAIEAFKIINSEAVDLVFLDINMPEITGLSFARSMTRDIRIIFTTAYREYAVDGFDLQAVDYLLKPISFERLLQAVNKFMNEHAKTVHHEQTIDENDHENSFFVRSERKMTRINFDDILFIESLSDYVKIHLKEKIVVTRETLTNIEERLPGSDFLRIHRSYLVSVACIESFTNDTIAIEKHELPISRSHKDDVLKRLT